MDAKLQLFGLRDQSGKDCFDYCAYYGQIACFHSLMNYTLQKHKISSWKELEASCVLSEGRINEWLQAAKKQSNLQFVGFLVNLRERVIIPKDLSLLFSMVSSVNNNNKEQKMREKFSEFSNANNTALYLLNHCDKHTLTQLSKAVTNGLENQECGFDDSLLFLSKMVDNKQFVSSLEKCTLDCLSKNTNNLKKYIYFKNHLLNSKIWGLNVYSKENHNTDNDNNNNSTNEDEEKYKEKTEMKQNANVNNKEMLFDKVQNKILEQELKMQQKYIRENVIQEQKQCEDSWHDLVAKMKSFNLASDGIIRQNRLIIDWKTKSVSNVEQSKQQQQQSTDEKKSDETVKKDGKNAVNESPKIGSDRNRKNTFTSTLGTIKAHAKDYGRMVLSETQMQRAQNVLAVVTNSDLMAKKGIQCDYKANELPFDNVNGFDGLRFVWFCLNLICHPLWLSLCFFGVLCNIIESMIIMDICPNYS